RRAGAGCQRRHVLFNRQRRLRHRGQGTAAGTEQRLRRELPESQSSDARAAGLLYAVSERRLDLFRPGYLFRRPYRAAGWYGSVDPPKRAAGHRQAGPYMDDRPDQYVRLLADRRQHRAVPDAAKPGQLQSVVLLLDPGLLEW